MSTNIAKRRMNQRIRSNDELCLKETGTGGTPAGSQKGVSPAFHFAPLGPSSCEGRGVAKRKGARRVLLVGGRTGQRQQAHHPALAA